MFAPRILRNRGRRRAHVAVGQHSGTRCIGVRWNQQPWRGHSSAVLRGRSIGTMQYLDVSEISVLIAGSARFVGPAQGRHGLVRTQRSRHPCRSRLPRVTTAHRPRPHEAQRSNAALRCTGTSINPPNSMLAANLCSGATWGQSLTRRTAARRIIVGLISGKLSARGFKLQLESRYSAVSGCLCPAQNLHRRDGSHR